MSDSGPAIEVHDLHKRYGDYEAVRGIDLSVNRGEVFGLLGPNGAGKTTTVEILEGYRRRTSGEVSVLGYDPSGRERGFRRRIGIVLQSGGIYSHITPREALRHWASFYPHPAMSRRFSRWRACRRRRTSARASSPAGSCAASTSRSPWSEIRS